MTYLKILNFGYNTLDIFFHSVVIPDETKNNLSVQIFCVKNICFYSLFVGDLNLMDTTATGLTFVKVSSAMKVTDEELMNVCISAAFI